ncbi:hypothetical protein IAQ61_011243 [Plenodomus lingam]|uniref:uncharacterized protein n=1 Tax=Leptosphaeria maculans TaxID=5022 RepID=UPI003324FFD7|nr:hypothetical protein IAQ61_011243 [Plenodomus lingam]
MISIEETLPQIIGKVLSLQLDIYDSSENHLMPLFADSQDVWGLWLHVIDPEEMMSSANEVGQSGKRDTSAL